MAAPAILYQTDGTKQEIAPANGTTFSLGEMQGYVHGYIELLYLPDGQVMVVNEEGEIDNLPLNEMATVIAYHAVTVRGIRGDAIVCAGSMVE